MVNKNAEVIYYSRNAQNQLIGINKSKSGKLNITIDDNKIDEIIFYNLPDGKINPENKFLKNNRTLKGFDWRESERPKSAKDFLYNIENVKK